MLSDDSPQLRKECSHDDNLAKSIALLTKQVSKPKRKIYKRSSGYETQSNREFNNSNSSGSDSFSSYATHKLKDVEKSDRNSQSLKRDRSFRCHKCEGFGHTK